MVEIDDDIVDVNMMHVLEEELEKYHLKPVYILARHDDRNTFLEFAVIQRFIQEHALNKNV